MAKTARFGVDPRLTALLGEGYRSSEEALKELVDNAWDADAEVVAISLPEVLDRAPIVVEDDGTGMTELEVRNDYLRIASDRTSRKGDRTGLKKRKVKGRKGIGKFAGLIAAQEMLTETWVDGTLTSVTITKPDLRVAQDNSRDLEGVDLPLSTRRAPEKSHGTRVTLSGLNQKFAPPSPEKLRTLLMRDYGREDGFTIIVNDVPIAIDDVPGKPFELTSSLPGVGEVVLQFTLSEEQKSVKNAGIVIRVGGKIIGRPSFLGLDDDDHLPPKLLKRIYGEINADGLAEHVTADWGAIIENSEAYQQVIAWAGTQLKSELKKAFTSEVKQAKARWEKELHRRLTGLPESRRKQAGEVVQKVLVKLYGEPEERIEAVFSVMFEAIERLMGLAQD